MLLLAIDTAGPVCAVALARASPGRTEILARRSERIGRGHAERLMPDIEAVLADAHAAFADIGRIAVTTGPGSFTGVRIGIAAARALALALDIRAVGTGSLEALLAGAGPEPRGTAIAVLDARRGEVYLAARDAASGAALAEPAVLSLAAATSLCRDAKGPLMLVGSGAPLLAASLGDKDFRIAGTPDAPDIADVAALGFAAAGGAPIPLYLRGADAKPQTDKAVALQ